MGTSIARLLMIQTRLTGRKVTKELFSQLQSRRHDLIFAIPELPHDALNFRLRVMFPTIFGDTGASFSVAFRPLSSRDIR